MASRTTGGNAAFRNFHNDYLYIVDPNERRRLCLNEIDEAPFGCKSVIATSLFVRLLRDTERMAHCIFVAD